MFKERTATSLKRPGRNVVMLVLSLFLGGVGVIYSKHYIEQQIAYYKGQLDKTEPMASVVVPNRKLLRGEVVAPSMLSTRDIPVKYADSNAVNGNNYEIALGQRIDFDVDEGRPLLWAHLEGGLAPTFSGKVPEGLRALTVRVDDINSISGFLQPRDSVDLLLSHGTGKLQEIFPLIDRLEVIATGVQTLVDKNAASGKRAFSTITVQVTPIEAQRITLAQQVGKLTAVLRNPDDESPLKSDPMNVADMLGVARPIAPADAVPKSTPPRTRGREPEPPRIEYIIGGS